MSESHENLLDSFRAYLHTVITADQYGQSKRIPDLPGPNLVSYCATLAKLPDNTLADELSAPVGSIISNLNETARFFYRPLYHKQIKDPAEIQKYEAILEQLDFALALILRNSHVFRFRAKRTKCIDLSCEVIGPMLHGDEAAQLIRRYAKDNPDEGREKDGSITDGGFIETFAWDTYCRVQQLDKLADEFPDHVRLASRRMRGWPMLIHRHAGNQKHFKELADRLELGAEYPLDATTRARFRPETPLVRYLVPLLENLDYVRDRMISGEEYRNYESLEDEMDALRSWWRDVYNFNEEPGAELMEASRILRHLPNLTKATAIEWAEKAIVPVIMATDATDWKNCEEPALKTIAKQRGVKSRATFKSRLLAAVSATLRRLARQVQKPV